MTKILRFNDLPAVPNLTCRYCEHWIHAEKIDSETKRCRAVRKEIRRKDSSCDQFQLHDDFWCDRCEQGYTMGICIARQKRSFEKCYNCKQGRPLWDYIQAIERRKGYGQQGIARPD